MTLRPASAHANSWRQDLDGISGAIRQQLFDKGSYNVAEVRKVSKPSLPLILTVCYFTSTVVLILW